MDHVLFPLFARGPVLMGVINVTPDSFSDGGKFFEPRKAIEHGLRLVEEGAQILDIGGESTRPGSEGISAQEEQDRILPVIEGLKDCGAILSVDTWHAETMRVAIRAGVGMINDITALTGEEESLSVVAETDVVVCLMHMQGRPKAMQNNPFYKNALEEVFNYLKRNVEICSASNLQKNRIVIDPGIGFGKSLDHNIHILKGINKFFNLGVPVLLGASRKSFIEKIVPQTLPHDRIPGSLASILWAYQNGVRFFRVHDVKETRQALEVYRAISECG